MDTDLHWTDERAEQLARSIDLEAERLNRLVRNLLDLSRIEAGALRPRIEPFDLGILVGPVRGSPRASIGRERRDRSRSAACARGRRPPRRGRREPARERGPLCPGARRPDLGRLAPDGRVLLRVEDAGRACRTRSSGALFERSSRAARRRGVAAGTRARAGRRAGPLRGDGLPRFAPGGASSAASRSTAAAGSAGRTGGAPAAARDRLPTRARTCCSWRTTFRPGRRSPRISAGTATAWTRPARSARRSGRRTGAARTSRPRSRPAGSDGAEIVRAIRRDATTPILILSARGGEPDKVAALELGADDYVTKPFGMAELRARVPRSCAARPARRPTRRGSCARARPARRRAAGGAVGGARRST